MYKNKYSNIKTDKKSTRGRLATHNNIEKLSKQLSARYKETLMRKVNSLGEERTCVKRTALKSRVEFATINNKTAGWKPKPGEYKNSENIEPEELDTQSIHPFIESEALTNARYSRSSKARFESHERIPLTKSEAVMLKDISKDNLVIDLSEMTEEVNVKVNNVLKFPSYQISKFHNRRNHK